MSGNSQYVFVRRVEPITVNATLDDRSSASFPHTVPSGDFRCLIVLVYSRIPANQLTTSVKFGSVALTRRSTVVDTVFVGELLTLSNPTPSTDTIEVIWPDVTTASCITVFNFVGVNSALPVSPSGTEVISAQNNVVFDSLLSGLSPPSLVLASFMNTGSFGLPRLKSNMVEITESWVGLSPGETILMETWMFLPETSADRNMRVDFQSFPSGVGIIAQVFREASIVIPGDGWAW